MSLLAKHLVGERDVSSFIFPEGPELLANPLQEPLAAWVIGSKGASMSGRLMPPHLEDALMESSHKAAFFFFKMVWDNKIK